MRAVLLVLTLLLSATAPAMAEPAAPPAGQARKVAPIILQPASALLSGGSPVVAGPTIKCSLKVRKIGPLTLDDALVVIANRVVEVRSNVEPPGIEPLLRGAVLRLDETGTAYGANRLMSGLVLFHSGQMLWQLSDQEAQHLDGLPKEEVRIEDQGPPVQQDELVFARSGSVAGRITDVEGNMLLIRDRSGQMQKVPLDTVTYVRSPRVYIFTITGQPAQDQSHTHVDSISFKPTANPTVLGDQVMVGKRRDMFDDDLDDPLMPVAPTIRGRQVEPVRDFGIPPQRPFSNWP